MCQLAIKDVAEDLGITVRMCRESGAACDSVLIEDPQRAKILKFGIVIACERECVVGVEPAVIRVAALCGASRDDLCVREGFRHGILDCVDSCHRGFDW